MSDADVKSGRSNQPDPNAEPCEWCGHVWFAGERRHVRHRRAEGAVRQPPTELVLCSLCLGRLRVPTGGGPQPGPTIS